MEISLLLSASVMRLISAINRAIFLFDIAVFVIFNGVLQTFTLCVMLLYARADPDSKFRGAISALFASRIS